MIRRADGSGKVSDLEQIIIIISILTEETSFLCTNAALLLSVRHLSVPFLRGHKEAKISSAFTQWTLDTTIPRRCCTTRVSVTRLQGCSLAESS